METDDKIVWGRCRSGKRWFWCVWIRWTDTIIAHGRADSVQECERKAMQYGPLYEEQAGYAESRRRQVVAIRRQDVAASRQQITNNTAVEEFVFVPFHDDNTGRYTRHKSVKRTKAKIFVEKEGEPCRADGQPLWQKSSEESRRAWSIRMIALDRKAIEQEG